MSQNPGHGARHAGRRAALALAGALGLAAGLFPAAAAAQQVRVTGSMSATFSDERASGRSDVAYDCLGEPLCVGSYTAAIRSTACSNTISRVGELRITGVDLSRAGPIGGTFTATGGFSRNEIHPNGTCSIQPGTDFDLVGAFTGSWDGAAAGTIDISGLDTGGLIMDFRGTFKAERAAPPPVFPMEVRASFDSEKADVAAQIRFRPEDVGTTGSVYVFALAPAPLVKSSGAKAAHFGHIARGDTDTPVQCVLAQLSSSGQLVGVTAANMQAYVTGVLSGQGQAVTMLDGVPTANVAGATFYVGYGSTANAMLDGGINRSAATAPGAVQCKPEAPETGWWWNTAEGGRGYSLEVRGNHLFFAAFHYDVSGRSTWHVATGLTSLDGSLYSNQPLYAASGGQTLAGAYRGKPTLANLGPITLAFADKRTGTMIWPGGVVAIERFNIVQDGLQAQPKANQPESGWWWNAEEDGRGFFMEWQNGTIDLAGYMYDEQGNPVWYLAVYETPDIRAMNGNWWNYANGQTMGGAYKAATRVSDNVAPVSITFSGPDTALMTLPGGRTTQLRRHRF